MLNRRIACGLAVFFLALAVVARPDAAKGAPPGHIRPPMNMHMAINANLRFMNHAAVNLIQANTLRMNRATHHTTVHLRTPHLRTPTVKTPTLRTPTLITPKFRSGLVSSTVSQGTLRAISGIVTAPRVTTSFAPSAQRASYFPYAALSTAYGSAGGGGGGGYGLPMSSSPSSAGNGNANVSSPFANPYLNLASALNESFNDPYAANPGTLKTAGSENRRTGTDSRKINVTP